VSPREKGFGKRWRLHATQKTPSNGLALFARQRLAFFNAVLMTTLSCSNTTVDQGGHELPTTAGILFLTREFANKTRFISVRAETNETKMTVPSFVLSFCLMMALSHLFPTSENGRQQVLLPLFT
jgi:hypothetical protein